MFWPVTCEDHEAEVYRNKSCSRHLRHVLRAWESWSVSSGEYLSSSSVRRSLGKIAFGGCELGCATSRPTLGTFGSEEIPCVVHLVSGGRL